MSDVPSYIAFISYRHLPLDKEAAKRVQKKIENYTIPKEFQEKFGGKKFGHVFRDEDELPTTSSLSDSIYSALDNTKFLIVICTPGLPQSKWCEAEIKYFLKTHDRDHIIAVLADGTTEESFSPYLLHDFDEEGNVIADHEPLAANIAGPNHTINNKAFNKEMVRLFASFIGCPFDSLWQRERRARTNRLLSLAAVVIGVLCVFLGVVMNRNARIREQNVKIEEQNTELQTRLSSVLVDGGLAKLESHDVSGAVEDALTSMESGNPAIYDHRVGKLLSRALCAYEKEEMRSIIVHSQSTGIKRMHMTDDKKHMILLDKVGLLRCLDLETYETLWETMTGDSETEVYTANLDDRIVYKSHAGAFCLSLKDGAEIWSFLHKDEDGNMFHAISEDGSLLAVYDWFNDLGTKEIVFINTKDGTERGRIDLTQDEEYEPEIESYEQFYYYAGAFSADNTRFVYVIPGIKEDETEAYRIWVADMNSLEQKRIGTINDKHYLFYGVDIDAADDSVFLAAYTRSSIYTVYGIPNGDEYEFTEKEVVHKFTANAGFDYAMDFFGISDCRFLSNKGRIYIVSDNQLFVYEREGNKFGNNYSTTGSIVNAYWTDREKGVLELVSSNGYIADYYMSTKEGMIMSSVYGSQSDQSNVTRACSYGNGSVDNYGFLYTISDEAPGKLFLIEFVSDPNRQTLLEGKTGDDNDYQYVIADGQDVGLLVYRDNSIVSFDKKTGETLKTIATEDYLDYRDIVLLDSDHFICGQFRYGMDGTVEEYAEPVAVEYSEMVPTRSVRMHSGQALSWDECALYNCDLDESQADSYNFSFGNPQFICPWVDGKPVEGLCDPAKTVLFFTDGWDHHPAIAVGEGGLIAQYGNIVDLSGDTYTVREEKELCLSDVLTGKTVVLKNQYPDSGELTPVVGHAGHLFAAAYADGKICLYDIETESAQLLDTHYSAGEITSVSFSDDDAYLLVLTSSGSLDIYETGGFTRVFSERIDLFIEDEGLLSMEDMAAQTVADKEALLVKQGSDYVIVDTAAWTEIVSFKGNFVNYDGDTGKVFSQTYSYGDDRETTMDLLNYPFYDIPTLQEWAERTATSGVEESSASSGASATSGVEEASATGETSASSGVGK